MPGLVIRVLEQPDRIGKVQARLVGVPRAAVEVAETQVQPRAPARLCLWSQASDGCFVRLGSLGDISLKTVKISQVG